MQLVQQFQQYIPNKVQLGESLIKDNRLGAVNFSFGTYPWQIAAYLRDKSGQLKENGFSTTPERTLRSVEKEGGAWVAFGENRIDDVISELCAISAAAAGATDNRKEVLMRRFVLKQGFLGVNHLVGKQRPWPHPPTWEAVSDFFQAASDFCGFWSECMESKRSSGDIVQLVNGSPVRPSVPPVTLIEAVYLRAFGVLQSETRRICPGCFTSFELSEDRRIDSIYCSPGCKVRSKSRRARERRSEG